MLEAIQTVLGFDFGLKRIGVATGQQITATAAPLNPLAARDGIPDWTKVEAVVKEWRPHALLVGLPLNMDDSESELSHLARKFARRLEGRYQLPVFMVDERLTSRAARELLAEIGDRRKGKLPSLDSTAAVLMVESWLQNPLVQILPTNAH
jgi:putative Holliday junction resolvase